jgi:hypothetical protein
LHPEKNLARKSDGSVWQYEWVGAKRRPIFGRTEDDSLNSSSTLSENRSDVDAAGKLWANLGYWDNTPGSPHRRTTGRIRMGNDSDWTASSITWDQIYALKTDGTLWKWELYNKSSDTIPKLHTMAPNRASEYSDWIGMIGNNDNDSEIITLSADGSLWAWADPDWYRQTLIKPSKRPRYLGNIFVAND